MIIIIAVSFPLLGASSTVKVWEPCERLRLITAAPCNTLDPIALLVLPPIALLSVLHCLLYRYCAQSCFIPDY